eukprot:1009866-Pleurochrysis_carterae.AAC.2
MFERVGKVELVRSNRQRVVRKPVEERSSEGERGRDGGGEREEREGGEREREGGERGREGVATAAAADMEENAPRSCLAGPPPSARRRAPPRCNRWRRSRPRAPPASA